MNSKLVRLLGLSSLSDLSQHKRREHRFIERMSSTMVNMSVKEGCKNIDVVRRPDYYIRRLVKAGILPQEAVVGQLKFGAIVRTGCAVNIGYLVDYENDIKDFIEDYTDGNAEDVFNVMGIGSVIALFNNMTKAESELLKDVSPVVVSLPARMQQLLFTSRQAASPLFHD